MALQVQNPLFLGEDNYVEFFRIFFSENSKGYPQMAMQFVWE